MVVAFVAAVLPNWETLFEDIAPVFPWFLTALTRGSAVAIGSFF
jgi:hypothetical protein